MRSEWWWCLIPVIYVLASTSPAYLAGRLKGIDLRQHGSGNLGATNAGRVLGLRWFIAVFACDVLKGLLPVLFAHWLERRGLASSWLALAAAAAALAGHTWTCFHGFKGGKAVATSLGVLIGLVWQVGAVSFVTWVVVVALGRLAGMRYAVAVTPASVIAAFSVPVTLFWVDPTPWQGSHLPVTILFLAMTTLVELRHVSNIRRFILREEAPPGHEPARAAGDARGTA